MPRFGLRKIRTPFMEKPSRASRRERIRIPQPADKPFNVRSARSIINDEYLSKLPWWQVVHKRGPKRPWVTGDPRERRAVQGIRGTLPERIVYMWLVKVLRLVSGVDFSFQASQDGGRANLGGLVVDFLFPIMMMVINVQGPTHKEYLRSQKDKEQTAILEDMGYRVYDLWDWEIYDEYLFENKMRKLFNIASGNGSVFGGQYSHELVEETEIRDSQMWDEILKETVALRSRLQAIFSV